MPHSIDTHPRFVFRFGESLRALLLIVIVVMVCGTAMAQGTFTVYSLPNDDVFLFFIAPGPDGNIWFSSQGMDGSGKVGRITPLGVITEFATPGVGAPGGITAGPDGNLWLTQGTEI